MFVNAAPPFEVVQVVQLLHSILTKSNLHYLINVFWNQTSPKCKFLHHLILNPKGGAIKMLKLNTYILGRTRFAGLSANAHKCLGLTLCWRGDETMK